MEESEVGHVRILVYPTKLGIRAGSSRVWRGEGRGGGGDGRGGGGGRCGSVLSSFPLKRAILEKRTRRRGGKQRTTRAGGRTMWRGARKDNANPSSL